MFANWSAIIPRLIDRKSRGTLTPGCVGSSIDVHPTNWQKIYQNLIKPTNIKKRYCTTSKMIFRITRVIIHSTHRSFIKASLKDNEFRVHFRDLQGHNNLNILKVSISDHLLLICQQPKGLRHRQVRLFVSLSLFLYVPKNSLFSDSHCFQNFWSWVP